MVCRGGESPYICNNPPKCVLTTTNRKNGLKFWLVFKQQPSSKNCLSAPSQQPPPRNFYLNCVYIATYLDQLYSQLSQNFIYKSLFKSPWQILPHVLSFSLFRSQVLQIQFLFMSHHTTALRSAIGNRRKRCRKLQSVAKKMRAQCNYDTEGKVTKWSFDYFFLIMMI